MRTYLILNLVVILLSAPWWFTLTGDRLTLAGFPLWAVYCLVVAVGYAIFVAVSLARVWAYGQEDDPRP